MNLHIFDIDDTICSDGETLSKNNQDTLYKLKEKGNIIWFASARNFIMTKNGLDNNINLIGDARILTENGGHIYQKGNKIFNGLFSYNEKNDLKNLFKKEAENIDFLDYWEGENLYTYNPNNRNLPEDEIIYRKKIIFEQINISESCMFHVIFKKSPGNISKIKHIKSGLEYNFLPDNINKGLILSIGIPNNIEIINIYGNGDNDIELFKIGKTLGAKLHCVGRNKKLLDLADLSFLDFNNLFEYIGKNI